MGKDGKCTFNAVACWATSGDDQDPWDTCEECQENDFGGWPEEATAPDDGGETDGDNDDPAKETRQDQTTKGLEKSETNDAQKLKNGSEKEHVANNMKEKDKEYEMSMNDEGSKKDKNESDDNSNNSDEVEQEKWSIERLVTIDEIESDNPPNCQTVGCSLISCSLWKSDSGEEWRSCLDCQEKVCLEYENSTSYFIFEKNVYLLMFCSYTTRTLVDGRTINLL